MIRVSRIRVPFGAQMARIRFWSSDADTQFQVFPGMASNLLYEARQRVDQALHAPTQTSSTTSTTLLHREVFTESTIQSQPEGVHIPPMVSRLLERLPALGERADAAARAAEHDNAHAVDAATFGMHDARSPFKK